MNNWVGNLMKRVSFVDYSYKTQADGMIILPDPVSRCLKIRAVVKTKEIISKHALQLINTKDGGLDCLL